MKTDKSVRADEDVRAEAMTVTLWRPETGVTSTKGLGEHRHKVYSSKAACIAGMHRDALKVMEQQPAAFTNHLGPGICGRYESYNFHSKEQPKPSARQLGPDGVPGWWVPRSRAIDPKVAVTEDYVDITYTYESTFEWHWLTRVESVVDGVALRGRKEHKKEDPAGWRPYVASYSKDGQPTRSGKRLRPESFTVTVGDPAAVAALLLGGVEP